MIYAFICKDGGDKTQIRRDVLLEHLRYIESVIDNGLINQLLTLKLITDNCLLITDSDGYG